MPNWYNPKVQKMFYDFEIRRKNELVEYWQNEYYKKVQKGEDDILFKVLTTYLNRTPDVEDYKRCQMIYRSGIDHQYTFCYDNFPLGYIKRSFEDLRYNVTFTPINK